MIPVTRAVLPRLEDYQALLERIWQSGQLTNNGALVRELSKALAGYLSIGNIELVANGTLALQLSIRALDLKGEIITTPYSYVATANAIIWEGCDPVFVDIEDQTFCIDPDRIEAAITEKTSAILATHVYGYPCDVRNIQSIADKHNLKVVYDAAHAFGVRHAGKSLATFGDCSILSFHATKVFNTAEGGALVCRDRNVAERAFLMSKFGHIGEDDYLGVGINAKMSELHAAMGLCNLPNVDQVIELRKACSAQYCDRLDGSSIHYPIPSKQLIYNYSYFPVVFSSHDMMMYVRQMLLQSDIGPRRYFFPSLNTLPFLREDLRRACPVSESISSRVLCLPLYAGLEATTIDRICTIVRRALSDR